MLKSYVIDLHDKKMVRSEGIEPPTCRLGGGRSIRLSYERNMNEYSIR